MIFISLRADPQGAKLVCELVSEPPGGRTKSESGRQRAAGIVKIKKPRKGRRSPLGLKMVPSGDSASWVGSREVMGLLDCKNGNGY
jgi:hypothetical protein